MKRIVGLVLALASLSGCENRELSLCDITDSHCQESVYFGDLRVRGDGYDPFGGIPPIRTIDEAQYRAELQAEAAQSASDPSAQQPWWDSAFALLHFMPSASGTTQTSIDNQVEQVAAYYEPSSKKVTVIDHKKAQSNSTLMNNMITLAHELVHAIQDRELDLKIDPKTSDDLFVSKALIEGDATLYEYLFAAELEPRVRELYEDPLAYTKYERGKFMADGPKLDDGVNFATLGPPYLAALYLVYPLGGMWMSEHYARGGNSAVRHAYGKAPKRSLEYLLPFGADVPSSPESDCAPNLPTSQGYAARGKDILGAVQLYAYMMGWGAKSSDAEATASLWRDDVMYVAYNPGTKKTVVAWRIELAQPLSASTLAKITTSDGPRVVQEGNILLITASDDADLTATWNPSTSCN